MSASSARASLAFSAVGHSYAHLFEPIFYIVALVLPSVFGMPYEEVLALVIAGKLLFGLAAPAAGWLGDRWSTTAMMTIYFLGLGASAIGVGLSQTPWQMAAALTAMGIFGSIYHPVGIAWLVRNAVNRGQAIGINGVFGGLGPAFAGLLASGLIAWSGWRAAFIIPGSLVILTGLAFLYCLRAGIVVDTRIDRAPQAPASRQDTMRAGILLAVTMLGGGLVYQATQVALPKLFEERLFIGNLADMGVVGVGGAVAAVYFIAGLSQIVAGHLADRFPAKWVYAIAYLLQIPLLFVAAGISGLPLMVVAVIMVTFNMAGIPAENVLLARYTPSKWRGTAFGFKFVLTFGVSGLAVPLVSLIKGTTGDFFWLFMILTASAVIVAITAAFLPSERKPEPVGQALPAE